MITFGLVVLGISIGYILVILMLGRRGSHTRRRETGQERRVEEIHDTSERYRAVAAHLEIKARERQRERERRQEIERRADATALRVMQDERRGR